MKSVVLGIMILSVSASFAQEENATHQLKNRFKAKKMMTVDRPAEAEITSNNSESKQFEVLSRKEVKSDFTTGVIRVKNGTPFIDIQMGETVRRVMPVRLPKAMAIDGQEIQFRYTVSDQPLPRNGKCDMVVQLHDVAQIKRR